MDYHLKFWFHIPLNYCSHSSCFIVLQQALSWRGAVQAELIQWWDGNFRERSGPRYEWVGQLRSVERRPIDGFVAYTSAYWDYGELIFIFIRTIVVFLNTFHRACNWVYGYLKPTRLRVLPSHAFIVWRAEKERCRGRCALAMVIVHGALTWNLRDSVKWTGWSYM